MKLAIIIPAYNEEKFIGPCLESIFAQSVKADEVIVVDNNSRDRTAEIAQSLGATVLNETRQGMTPARNRGLNSATSDILGRIDADTILLPGWVERVKKRFEEDSSIVGLTGPVVFYDALRSNTLGSLMGKAQKFFFFKSARLALGHDVLFGSNMAIRQDAWLKIKDEVCLDDSLYHEDSDITGHIAHLGKIVYDPQLLASISKRAVYKLRSFDYLPKYYRSLKHARTLARSHRAR